MLSPDLLFRFATLHTPVDLKVGMSETTILHHFHPDAQDLFNVTCDLKGVCDKLTDPSQRYQRQVALPPCPGLFLSTAAAVRGFMVDPHPSSSLLLPVTRISKQGRRYAPSWRLECHLQKTPGRRYTPSPPLPHPSWTDSEIGGSDNRGPVGGPLIGCRCGGRKWWWNVSSMATGFRSIRQGGPSTSFPGTASESIHP